jgi:hypothetical protein
MPSLKLISNLRVIGACCLLSGCAASTWDMFDPEYETLLPYTGRDWPENKIVGVWVTKTQPRFGLPERRWTMLCRPDHTVQMRVDGLDGGDATWSYNGHGVWTITPRNFTAAMYSKAMGQEWLSFTVRYAGRYVLLDGRFNGGVLAQGGIIRGHQLLAPADDEEAVQHVVSKRY